MPRWAEGEKTVQYLVEKGRLESFEAEELGELAEALIGRADLRVETTAAAALAGGDVDGAYVAAYDAYRMAADALLARRLCAPRAATGRLVLGQREPHQGAAGHGFMEGSESGLKPGEIADCRLDGPA